MAGSNKITCCGGLVTTVASAGVVILIYWAIFQPHHIRATVNSATLSNLTVANATSGAGAGGAAARVSYHLTVELGFYNPSVRVNIYYDALEAVLRLGDAVLGPANGTSPAEFYQLRKTGNDVKVEFDGRGVAVAGDMAAELEREIRGAAPAVTLEVAVDALVRYRFRSIKIRQKPRIRCSLTIPVKPEHRRRGVGGVLANGDPCSVKY